MPMRMPLDLSRYLYFGLVAGLWSCAATPDSSESRGTCALQCSGSRIAGAEMRIRFLTENLQVSCAGIADNQEYIGSVPIRFVVENPQVDLPADNVPAVGTNNEEEATPFNPTQGQPVSGIGFEALVASGFLGQQNPDDPRFKYKGILTPKDEWCTDTCGVGTIDILPLCKQVNNVVTILIKSGSVLGTVQVTVSP